MENQTEDVTIGDRVAVLSRPTGAGRWPGVVMLHEAFGINDVLRRQATGSPRRATWSSPPICSARAHGSAA